MNSQNVDLKEMQTTVAKIEQYTLKLQASGAGIPVVEKNTRIILSIVNNLKFGISDPAKLMDL
jgi:hypothetical protein